MALQSVLQPHPFRTVWPESASTKCDDCGALATDPRHRLSSIRLDAAGVSRAGLVRFAPPTTRWHGFAGPVFGTPALHLELRNRRLTEYVLALAGSVAEGTSAYTLRTIGWTFGRHSKLGRDVHLRLHGEQNSLRAIWTLTEGTSLEGLLASSQAWPKSKIANRQPTRTA